MAKNVLGSVVDPTMTLRVRATHPAAPASGDPCRAGDICGVALNTENADGDCTMYIGPGFVNVNVEGVDAGGNVVVAMYDKLYYNDGDNPPVNKKVAGKFFGTAFGSLGIGATGVIKVLLGR